MSQHAAGAVLALALSLVGADARAGLPACPAARAADFGSIHPLDARLAALMREAIVTSTTFQKLVDQVSTTDGLVMIEVGPAPSRGGVRLRGAMMHNVIASGPYRLIRINVWPSVDLVTIGTLAHELQHAIEVLSDPRIRDTDAVEALYRRIGFAVQAGTYETEAAADTGRHVIAEVQACRATQSWAQSTSRGNPR